MEIESGISLCLFSASDVEVLCGVSWGVRGRVGGVWRGEGEGRAGGKAGVEEQGGSHLGVAGVRG